jgi:hypothetical protein
MGGKSNSSISKILILDFYYFYYFLLSLWFIITYLDQFYKWDQINRHIGSIRVFETLYKFFLYAEKHKQWIYEINLYFSWCNTLSLLWKRLNMTYQGITNLVASFVSIPIVLAFWDRFPLSHTSQTWFLAFLEKYHLCWGLLNHMIKRFASVGIKANIIILIYLIKIKYNKMWAYTSFKPKGFHLREDVRE